MEKVLVAVFVITLLIAFQKPSYELVNLEVEIVGLDDYEGQMVIAIFNKPDEFLKKDYKHVKITSLNDRCIAKFSVPAGTYAASVFHDKNMNGELDTNFIGFPKEPYGFSNNATGSFGPPNFIASSFEVIGSKRVSIKLK